MLARTGLEEKKPCRLGWASPAASKKSVWKVLQSWTSIWPTCTTHVTHINPWTLHNSKAMDPPETPINTEIKKTQTYTQWSTNQSYKRTQSQHLYRKMDGTRDHVKWNNSDSEIQLYRVYVRTGEGGGNKVEWEMLGEVNGRGSGTGEGDRGHCHHSVLHLWQVQQWSPLYN